MDRIRAGDLRGGDDPGDVEVRFARRRRPDADVVVGESDVERLPVGVRVDGDGLESELAARPNDAERDLAAIGDEDFPKHERE
jgi:hypothetical protein